jgi:hypothetical protein
MSAALLNEGQHIALRVTGGKPLRFRGELLAEATSRRAATSAWHDITVYRCETADFAASLRLCGTPTEIDRAARFTSLDALETWFETFDPTADLHAGFDVADPALTGAALAVKAASLRDRAEDLRRAYQALIGELLFRLETELEPA